LAVQLALLIFWIKNPITKVSVPSASIEFVSALAVVFLVVFEHPRIVHPSSLLWIYLLASVVSAAVRTRTLFLRGYEPTISRLAASSLACNLALLIVESWSKKSYLKPADREYGPEELAGIFSRSVFWWLTPILFLGNRKILKLSDLYPLDRNLRSKPLQERIVIEWEKRTLSRFYISEC
jgi:ATP-binding cassette subfamily C (CFTR/MRP) protein 1